MLLGKFIRLRRKELGYSAEQVAEHCGVNPSTVYRWENGDTTKIPSSQLKALAQILRVKPSELVDDEVNVPVNLSAPELVRTIPVYGPISCGTGLFVEDQVIDTISVPVSMLPNKSAEYFAQYASGDSMIDAGIHNGDLIIFKKSPSIENGQIGCFCIDENEAVCKKFSQVGGNVYLLSMNDKYSPIPIEPENHCFRILGIKALLLSK